MANRCKRITPKISEAGRKLSTSNSPAVKSAAGRKLAKHKAKNH